MAIYDWTESLQRMAQATAPSGGVGVVGNMAQATAPYGAGISTAASKSGVTGGNVSNIGREAPPTITPYNYGPQATQYPQYMMAAGERMAQQAFQQRVNSGVRTGNSVQGYEHALDNETNDRLTYMSAAGKEALTVGNAEAQEADRLNKDRLAIYGGNITQRGQDIGYQESLNRVNAAYNGSTTLIAGSNRAAPGRTVSIPGAAGGTVIRMDPYGDSTSSLGTLGGNGWQGYAGSWGDSTGSSSGGGGGSFNATQDSSGVGSWVGFT